MEGSARDDCPVPDPPTRDPDGPARRGAGLRPPGRVADRGGRVAEVLFWGVVACLALASLGLALAPMLRGGRAEGPRASYDMRIYRDQLREVEADRARGVLTEAEAEASRVEVSRRLLAAADGAAGAVADGAAPRGLSRAVALGLIAALALAGAALYARIGAPGLPDAPLRARMEADAKLRAARPGQDAVEAMLTEQAPPDTAPKLGPEDAALLDKLRTVLVDRPDDLEGHRLLSRNMSALGRWQEARVAQGAVVRILGDRATADDLVEWAELMILAANGYVSPEAEAALGRALALDPTSKPGRFYSGVTLIQGGRPDLAYGLWTGLLAEGPPDAPWVATIKAGIGEVARQAGLPPPDTGAAGPGQAEIDAAAAMTPAEREGMIAGMVERLRDRLATEGGPPAQWAQLIQALGVQGRMDDAAAVWGEARAAYAADPAALATLAEAARLAGLTQ